MACSAGGAARPALAALARALLVTVSIGASVPGGVAKGQDRAGPPNEALQFYQSGRAHFRAGRYHEAIEDLERARMLDPTSPTLVYNLARVHELLGSLDRALPLYEQYMQMLPEGETEARQRTEETLERLRGARGQVHPDTRPQAPPASELLDAPVWVDTWGVADPAFWVTAVGAGVLLAVGAGFGAAALSAESDAEAIVVRTEDDAIQYQIDALNADDRALLADVMLGAGVVAAIIAGLLYALRSEKVETHPSYGRPEAFVTSDGRDVLVGVRGAL